MITEVPTDQEFRDSGVAFLNLGWEAAMSLERRLLDAELERWDTEGEVTDEYWAAAQRPLASAVALAYQGVEFLLKASVASVSPFLLFAGGPRDWPRRCHEQDTPYSAFKTVDAQELIRAHSAVGQPDGDAFRSRFETLRQQRNTIFHTVDRQQRFRPKQVFVAVLEAWHALRPGESWLAARQDYLHEEPEAQLGAEGQGYVVARELEVLLQCLTASECQRLLSFSKRQRFYFCPACAERKFLGLYENPKVAQLAPNSRTSTWLECRACGERTAIVRRQCPDCPGNVVCDDECLSCGCDVA